MQNCFRNIVILVTTIFLQPTARGQMNFVSLKQAASMHSDSVVAITLEAGDDPNELASYERLKALVFNGINVFPEHLRNLTLDYVIIRDFGNRQLPKFVLGLTHLKTLVIDDDSLITIPTDINELSNLENLVIMTPNLKRIGSESLFLPQLQYLFLDVGNVFVKTEHISCPKLEILEVSCSPLQLPKLSLFPKLRTFYLHDPKCVALPPAIFETCSLENIHVCSPLTDLPSSMATCSALAKLSLGFANPLRPFVGENCQNNLPSANELSILPDWICQLSVLQELSLRGSSISGIPECLQSLSMIRFIDISSTEIRTIPDVFFKQLRDSGPILIRYDKRKKMDRKTRKSLKKCKTVERVLIKSTNGRKQIILTKRLTRI
jgi:Leucine-rich repeat (LRR) protein